MGFLYIICENIPDIIFVFILSLKSKKFDFLFFINQIHIFQKPNTDITEKYVSQFDLVDIFIVNL